MKSIVKHFSPANILFEGLSEVRAALNYLGKYINMMNMIMFLNKFQSAYNVHAP
jgi:hypothetical protein